jgi:outer membrane protein TolC
MVAAVANAQEASNPFLGSVPRGVASEQRLALSLSEVVARGLKQNLGLLLQEESARQAHGARWRALAELLPDANVSFSANRQVINLAAFGLPITPSIVGPFNVVDARVSVSQPVVDLSAWNDARAASLNERAEQRGIRTAQDLVVLVCVNLYLQTLASDSRLEAARAQLDTAEALFRQASDLKASGVVAGIDVLRSQVEVQTHRQRLITAQNDFEKAKLQLGRAIGLPSGQAFDLTDRIPYTPLPSSTLEGALAQAFESRADYLAAADRLSAAEAGRRAATSARLPSVHVDADYGALGERVADARNTYTLAATVKVPIFNAGRIQARTADAEAELNRRKAEFEDLKGRIDMEVRAALLDQRAASQQVDAAQATVALAAQELEQARDRFAAGVAGNLDVTQAQETVANASESYISALSAYNMARASLARATGLAAESVTRSIVGH